MQTHRLPACKKSKNLKLNTSLCLIINLSYMMSNKNTNKREHLNNCWLTWRITQRIRNKSQINLSNTKLVLGEKIWSEADVSMETHFTSRGF